jgi:hypothetical protein
MTVDEIIGARLHPFDPTYANARGMARLLSMAIRVSLHAAYHDHQDRCLEAYRRGEVSPERPDEVILTAAIRGAVDAHGPGSVRISQSLCLAWRRECCPLDATQAMDEAAA